METKVCRQCKEDKPLEQFSKLSSAEDGKQKECKACNKINNAKFRSKRPAYQNKYYKTEAGKQNKLKALHKSWDSLGAGIYKLVNKQTGRFYIGSTTQLNRRKLEWWSYLNSPDQHKRFLNDDLYSDVIKYGRDAFEWSIVEQIEGGSKNKVTKREYEIIEMMSKLDINLYNVLGVGK